MRRAAVLSLVALLAFAGVALAAGSAKLRFNPNKAGAGTVGTIEATPPNRDKVPSSVVLKVAKGLKYDGRAVPRRCSDAQAKQNSCPPGSRAGGGKIDVTASPGGPVTVNVGLFLGPKRKPGDLVGLVAIATVPATGQQGHAFGRVRRIDEGKLGVETRFDKLNDALKPPPGFTVKVDHLTLRLGKNRMVDGKRVHLLRNPKTCNGGWAYRASVRYPDGSGKSFPGTAPCTP